MRVFQKKVPDTFFFHKGCEVGRLHAAIVYGVFCCMTAIAQSGCVQENRHEGHREAAEVRSGQTGELLSEWVVVDQITSDVGWNVRGPDRTIEVTTLLVMEQDPLRDRRQVESYVDGGVFVFLERKRCQEPFFRNCENPCKMRVCRKKVPDTFFSAGHPYNGETQY
jgi:hypothetical protein